MKAKDYIVDFLYKNNVRYVFTIGGGGNLALLTSIKQDGRIKIICNSHEQVCSMNALSYSAFNKNREIGVCLVTTGPGCTNTLTGLYSAYVDSIPVLFISGQVSYEQSIIYKRTFKKDKFCNPTKLRQNGTQEINASEIASHLTKKSYFIYEESKLPEILNESFELMLKPRQGPIWWDICANVFDKEIC